jgi:hypothetical protein
LSTASVPQPKSLTWWQRLRRRLGSIGFHERGGEQAVQTGGGNQMAQAQGNGANPNQIGNGSSSTNGSNGNGNGHINAEELFDTMLIERWEANKNEAGRPEGRVVPALKLGEQRYPDPRVWGPETDGPLMQDEGYREALALLRRLEERRERD